MISFTPVSLKKLKIINPFIRSATCEYLADEDGRPGKRFLELYKKLAKGNIGIIITGYAYVLPNGKSNPGQSGIYSDHLIPSWKEVTKVVKDSLFLMQIVHGGRQVRSKSSPGPIWAPSAVPDPVFKTNPMEMKVSQIEEVIDAFVKAAVRAQKSGFDGIQLHAAHGYLLSQFLSPYTNRRTDRYGGNQGNRTRIVVEIINGIKTKVNNPFVVSAKVNGSDCLQDGLNLRGSIVSAKILKDAGLDFIEVSGGMAESKNGAVRKNIQNIGEEGYFLDHATEIKKNVRIPTSAVGGFRTLSFIERTLRSSKVDMVGLCRPFIREPDLIAKFKREIIQRAACVSCNGCFNPKGVHCRFSGDDAVKNQPV